ncbi:CocE/NonD family hydrolase [Streptomyces eurythermus]|uniref:CocE/NonD family hydrolase n=1 Tax=Streptomyces eurythermus TaxID=42237 RepID=UPI0036D2D3A9
MKAQRHPLSDVIPRQSARGVLSNSDRYCVTCPDGTRLDVTVYDGDRAATAPPGSRPVVVLPTSWAASPASFTLMLGRLAASGYLTVGYTPRGFNGSGGRVGTASERDVSDFRTVLDWIENTIPAADGNRIAAMGVSYGAAISLLATAADDRISTVVAFDGWADLYQALAAGDTPRLASAALLSLGLLRGRPSQSLLLAIGRFFTGLQRGELKRWAAARSVSAHVERLNARQVSVLLAASWNDVVLRPEQFADLHAALTCRSVLLLHPGGHPLLPVAQLAEKTGRQLWEYAERWLDRELRELPTVVDDDGAVVVLDGDTPGGRRSTAGHTATLGLGAPGLLGPGPLAGRGGAWTCGLLGAIPSGATDRMPLMLPPFRGDRFNTAFPAVWFPLVPALAAGRWLSEPLPSDGHIRGCPTVRLAVTCPAPEVTLTAHLYEVGPAGFGRLVSQGATTTATGGRCPVPVSIRLRTTVRDVPAGRRIGLIVGTSDPTCLIRTRPLSRVTLHSPPAEPARLTLPLSEALGDR